MTRVLVIHKNYKYVSKNKVTKLMKQNDKTEGRNRWVQVLAGNVNVLSQ